MSNIYLCLSLTIANSISSGSRSASKLSSVSIASSQPLFARNNYISVDNYLRSLADWCAKRAVMLYKDSVFWEAYSQICFILDYIDIGTDSVHFKTQWCGKWNTWCPQDPRLYRWHQQQQNAWQRDTKWWLWAAYRLWTIASKNTWITFAFVLTSTSFKSSAATSVNEFPLTSFKSVAASDAMEILECIGDFEYRTGCENETMNNGIEQFSSLIQIWTCVRRILLSEENMRS